MGVTPLSSTLLVPSAPSVRYFSPIDQGMQAQSWKRTHIRHSFHINHPHINCIAVAEGGRLRGETTSGMLSSLSFLITASWMIRWKGGDGGGTLCLACFLLQIQEPASIPWQEGGSSGTESSQDTLCSPNRLPLLTTQQYQPGSL